MPATRHRVERPRRSSAPGLLGLVLALFVVGVSACGGGTSAAPGADGDGLSLAGVEIDVHQAPG